MTTGLPVSRLIDVSVNLSPPAASFPNLSTCLILGTSLVIDVVQRLRSYSSITQVAADFGTSAEEYLAAVLWFEQNPRPTSLLIGRWAKLAAAGQLIGGPVTAANQLLSAWTSITNGAFRVSVDGGGPQSLTGLSFAAATTLNGIATIINGTLAGAVCTWDSVNERFIFTSNTTGASSTVSFLTSGLSGTDISHKLAGLSTDGGYTAAGIVAESALAAVQIFENLFSSQWYGLVIPSGSDADHQAVGSYIEATTTLHFYGATTQAAGTLSAASTTDLAYLMKALDLNKSAVQYSSANAYAVVSLLARILTTNWQGNNTAITLMYKQEPGITAETLTETQISALEGKNCNVFVAYNNNTAIIEQGKACSGQFIDTVIGVDWLVSEIQTNLYNLLYGTNKVPQTDAGMHQLATQIAAACAQGVANGLLAPGTWNSGGFGQLQQGDYLDKGYYIYQPPISLQAQADRTARKSVPFQVAAKLAGAVHTVDVQVNVNS